MRDVVIANRPNDMRGVLRQLEGRWVTVMARCGLRITGRLKDIREGYVWIADVGTDWYVKVAEVSGVGAADEERGSE